MVTTKYEITGLAVCTRCCARVRCTNFTWAKWPASRTALQPRMGAPVACASCGASDLVLLPLVLQDGVSFHIVAPCLDRGPFDGLELLCNLSALLRAAESPHPVQPSGPPVLRVYRQHADLERAMFQQVTRRHSVAIPAARHWDMHVEVLYAVVQAFLNGGRADLAFAAVVETIFLMPDLGCDGFVWEAFELTGKAVGKGRVRATGSDLTVAEHRERIAKLYEHDPVYGLLYRFDECTIEMIDEEKTGELSPPPEFRTDPSSVDACMMCIHLIYHGHVAKKYVPDACWEIPFFLDVLKGWVEHHWQHVGREGKDDLARFWATMSTQRLDEVFQLDGSHAD